jgi:DUF2975 family protein
LTKISFMLKRFRLVDWVLAALIMLTIISSLSQCNFHNDIENTVRTGSLDTSPAPLNDSLPHYLYKKISDSIKQLQSLEKANSNARGNGWSFLSLGYSEINNNWMNDASNKQEDRTYYLALSGYKLEPRSEFYIENGRWLVKTPSQDLTNEGSKYVHFVSKQSLVRYSTQLDDRAGEVLVPFSKGQFQVVKILTWLLMIAIFVFGIRILFSIALFLMQIINKKTFSGENYRSLEIIGISFIVLSLLPFLIGLIMNLIFNNKIPDEINFPFWENLIRYKAITFTGLIILLIARAFKKGHKLQIDNEIII